MILRKICIIGIFVAFFQPRLSLTQVADASATNSKNLAVTGNVLVTPLLSQETILVDLNKKEESHVWKSEYYAAAGARLNSDGSILRIASDEPAKTFRNLGVIGGRVQHIARNGELLWDFWNAATYHMVCGDAIMLPNGNVLMVTADYKSHDDALKLGRHANEVKFVGLYAPGLMEFKPEGKNGARLIWRWSAWDHIVSGEKENEDIELYKRKIDVNRDLPGKGILGTEIYYDLENDLLALTLPAIGEVWILDHSTSVEEAASSKGGKRGFGGSLLSRLQSNDANGPGRRIISLDAVYQQNADGEKNDDALYKFSTLSVIRNSDTQAECHVESMTSPWSGTDNLNFINQITNLVRRWKKSFGKDHPSYPTYLSIVENSKLWMLSSRLTGNIQIVDSNGNEVWQYQNGRGNHQWVSIRPQSSDDPNVKVISRSQQIEATAEEISTKGSAPLNVPIGRPRYYPGDFLQSP